MGLGSKSTGHQLLSKIATNNKHGENSPYFDGWKAYEANPFHPTQNPQGVIQMGLAENQVYISYLFLSLSFCYCWNYLSTTLSHFQIKFVNVREIIKR